MVLVGMHIVAKEGLATPEILETTNDWSTIPQRSAAIDPYRHPYFEATQSPFELF